ncbi:phosphodiester glycosidase family protein [Brevibacillus sp. B_LB10_24]|uniref:phosphodiester glycosidase family protein n=1 Tax=Brevibacillus sp. B_LB10_24 TaxID=3380645 RepID=UPI0038BBB2B1
MAELSRVRQTRRKARTKRRRRWKLVFLSFLSTCFLFASAALFFLFATDTGTTLREWVAGTLLTTQHDYLARYTFLPEEKLRELKREISYPTVVNSAAAEQRKQQEWTDTQDPPPQPEKPRELVEVKPVEVDRGTYYFRGKMMLISDPNRVHLLVTKRTERGDLLDEFAKQYKTLGIVNASGFYDPDGYAKGQRASGLLIHDGVLLQEYDPRTGETALGLTYDGKLITGSYTGKQLLAMGVRDAMSFRPQLIVDGKNLFAGKPAQSWGIQPRTAIGQKADGTIVFLVIDGRQPNHSIGASMNDVADVLEREGVVTAMAMDGGSSSMMLENEEPITRTACPYPRGRFLPNAWAVY